MAQLFFAMGTQWRASPAGLTGLDYAALPPVATAHKIPLTPELLAKLQVMEVAALKELHRESKP